MDDPSEVFGGVLPGDLWELAVGDCLGSGASRHVYVWRPDPTLVLKIETDRHSWSNIEEWEVWRTVAHTAHAKWFAPVIQIAGGGSMLLQRRTQPLRPDELPEKIPAYLTDTKSENFGLLDGRFVCHDYGLHLLRERGLTRHMAKAEWWKSR